MPGNNNRFARRWKKYAPSFFQAIAAMALVAVLNALVPMNVVLFWSLIAIASFVVSLLPYWHEKEEDARIAPQGKPIAPVPNTVAPPDDDDRDWCTLSKQQLASLIKGQTDMMARKTIKPFKGQWMRDSGDVREVESSSNILSVSLECKGMPNVFCFFKKKDFESRLQRLRKGDFLSVEGQLYGVDETSVSLDNCQIVSQR